MAGKVIIESLFGKGPYREMLPKVREAIQQAIAEAKQSEQARQITQG